MNTEPKHTPGPWHHLDGFVLTSSKDIIHEDLGVMEESESNANARLIAAAPDMLEELERSLVELDSLIAQGEYNKVKQDVISNPDLLAAIENNLDLLKKDKDKRVALIARAKGEKP